MPPRDADAKLERGTAEDDTKYVVRPYRSGDGEGVRALRERVWGQRLPADWFEWKYLDNPYADEVPLFVAEAGGEVVGTRPFVAFQMRAGAASPVGLLATDTMVHPDHRRRGLFTRMTERALAHYAATDGGPAFVFNFPNGNSLPGYRKLGWRVVAPCATYYRVQDPAALARTRSDGWPGRLAGRAAAPAARGYLRLRRRLTGSTADVAVRRYDGVPSERLASLYEGGVPRAIHVQRDPAFYDWRFADPLWERATTYLAARDGRPVAGAVTQTRRTREGLRKVAVAEVVPLAGGADRTVALGALLRRIVDDNEAADVLVAPGGVIPHRTLAAHGFLSDGRLPLSLVAAPPFDLTVRSLRGDEGWTVGGRALDDRRAWLVSMCERPYY